MPKYLWKHELYHHGIKGQQWGVRNGPPYPLSRSEHNKVVSKNLEKNRTGVIKGTNSNFRDSKRRKVADDHATEATKAFAASSIAPRVLGIATAGAITMMLAYKSNLDIDTDALGVLSGLAGLGVTAATAKIIANTYGSEKSIANRTLNKNKNLKETADNYRKKPEVKNKSELSSLKTLSKEEADDVESVNEAFGVVERTTNNCAQCSLAYVMRQNGYNVVANNKLMDKIGKSGGLTAKEIAEAVGKSESDYVHINRNASDDSAESLNELIDIASRKSNSKDGLYLLNLHTVFGGGHSAVASVENGKTYIVDAQAGVKTESENYFKEFGLMFPDAVLSLSGSNLENDNICQYLKRGD